MKLKDEASHKYLRATLEEHGEEFLKSYIETYEQPEWTKYLGLYALRHKVQRAKQLLASNEKLTVHEAVAKLGF